MPALETVVQRSGDPTRACVSFANPVSTDCPSASTAQVSASPAQLHASDPVIAPNVLPLSLFVAYHTPDHPTGAAKEAILQENLMMEQIKVVQMPSRLPTTLALLCTLMSRSIDFRLISQFGFCLAIMW